MIYDRELALPALDRRRLTRGLSLFQEREGALSARAMHMRQQDGYLVCAEGAKALADLPSGDARLFFCEGVFAQSGNVLYELQGSGFVKSLDFIGKPNALVAFEKEQGGTSRYLLSSERLYRSDGTAVTGAPGGRCAALHYERLFIANGYRVYYSRPMAPEDWTYAVQGAGYLDLPSEDGEIVAMVSYKEKLYLFRERGITQLRVLGDHLNMKAAFLPYSYGELAADTVALCGDKILFLTTSGLYSFNGGVCTRIFCGAEQIDRAYPVVSAAYDGKYYVAARLLTGEKCLYCYDTERKTGHLIDEPAASLTGGDGLYFTARGKLCALTERGLPLFGRGELRLTTELSLLGLSEGRKFLDAVCPGGDGFFEIEVKSDGGERAKVAGRAGRELALPRPVRGNAFSLHIVARGENARLGDISLSLREERKNGY